MEGTATAALLFFSRLALSFQGSTGTPRHCVGASDMLEQGNKRLGKSYCRVYARAMEGTRVERKGREKVVACRRVERTAIVDVLARGSRI